jgi:hypothetical protein
MPINPNIALGAQPQQPVNMLGQVGQMLALKAATEEMRGNEDLRAAYAQGGDLNDPEFRRKVMAANPKLGSQLIKTNAETGKLQNEAIANRIKLSREMLTGVNTPEDYIAWHEANHKDPVLGGYLNQRGVTAEQSRAKIIADLAKPGGLDRLKRESALGATELQKELMQTERTRISSGPAYQQAALAQKEFDLKKAESDRIAKILQGESPTTVSAPVTSPIMGGGGGGAPAGATSSIFVNPASTNVLANQVAPTAPTVAPVNSLLNPPAGQGGVAPVANRIDQITTQLTQLSKINNPAANQAMERLIKEYNILNPEGRIEQNASGELQVINPRTKTAEPVLGKDGKPVMGKSTYETAFGSEVGKSQAARNEKIVTQAQAAPDNIRKIDETIAILNKGDATTGLGAEFRTNIDRARALFANDIKAGKRVSETQILDALLGSDVFPMIQSLGVGARGLDTPAEREYLRQVMTGTIQMDTNALIRLSEIRRNLEIRAIEKYNIQFEKGELNKYFETQGLKGEKIQVPESENSSTVITPDNRVIVFPNAAAAAKFRKEAGIK